MLTTVASRAAIPEPSTVASSTQRPLGVPYRTARASCTPATLGAARCETEENVLLASKQASCARRSFWASPRSGWRPRPSLPSPRLLHAATPAAREPSAPGRAGGTSPRPSPRRCGATRRGSSPTTAPTCCPERAAASRPAPRPAPIFQYQGYALLGGDQFDPRVFGAVVGGIANAVERADTSRVAARLGWGQTDLDGANHNRRLSNQWCLDPEVHCTADHQWDGT